MTSVVHGTVNHPEKPSTEQSRFPLSDNAYATMLSGIFVLLGGFVAWHHEMWRDEIQAWLIARDSSSPIEVLYHLNRGDGHPGLWHLCLYYLKQITWSPVIMQPFHLIIACTSVYVFVRFAPFTRLHKALFPFGYLVFYEYAVICRNYALGVLLLFVFCALFKKRQTRFPLLGFILLLLAHTNIVALIVAIAIAVGLAWELRSTSSRPSKRDIRVGFSLILFGILTSIIQLKPSTPGRFEWSDLRRGVSDLERFQNAVNIIPKAFIPIPEVTLRFWNTFLLDAIPGANGVKLALTVVILLFAVIYLCRKPAALLMYLIGTLGILAFFASYFGFIRHWGYLYILFLAAIWISRDCDDAAPRTRTGHGHFRRRLNQLSLATDRSLNHVLILLLTVQLTGGVVAAGLDYTYPFSEGKAVARFIKESELDDMIIAPEVRSDVSLEILGYLEKGQFYYPRPRRFGSFVSWDPRYASTAYLATEDVLQEIRRFCNEKSEDILIISGHLYPEDVRLRYDLTNLKVFRPSVIRESVQNFVLYRMSPGT